MAKTPAKKAPSTKPNVNETREAVVVDVDTNQETTKSYEPGQDDNASDVTDRGMAFDADSGTVERPGLGDDEQQGDEGDGTGDDTGEEGEGDGGEGEGEEQAAKEGDAPGEEADLGAYEEGKEASFNERYHDKDGQLDLQTLSREWWQNQGKAEGDNPDGSLNEGTYDYLAKKHGLSKGMVKQVEASIKVQTQATVASIVEAAGGQVAVDAAVKWARAKDKGGEGGFTPDQAKRFNEAMASTDPAVVQEAMELAVSRHQKALGGKKVPKKVAKDVTEGAARGSGQGDGDVFASQDEYREELRAAKNNQKLIAAATQKLARSPFYKDAAKKKAKGKKR